MSPKFMPLIVHLQYPHVSVAMKMPPEEHSVPLGPPLLPGAVYTSVTSLKRRAGEKRMTLLTQAPWLGIRNQMGSPAQKG